MRGDVALDALAFSERGFAYQIPLTIGQKTGFYFDQREVRGRVEELARGKSVLDTYSFVGAFALAAARGGATRVRAVDQSAQAVTIGADIARANHLDGHIEFVKEDAARALTEASNRGGFGLVICDPPKLAPSRANKEVALTAYRKIAMAGCRATTPGGILLLCSCSSAVSLEDLTRALALGAADARTRATVFERHFQGPDHPTPAAFPEGLYLKSVFCHVEPLSR